MKFKNLEKNGSNKKNLISPCAAKLLVILLLIIFMAFVIPVISALGCCFTPDDGFCFKNSEHDECIAPEGRWFDDENCGVSECQEGCCILGTNTEFITSRACDLISKEKGFEPEFSYVDEQACYEKSKELETGACVLPGEYENGCKYTTMTDCGDIENFHPGVYCSQLDNICEKTEATICYPEKAGDVHYLDACGNPDELAEDCEYDYGTICKQETDMMASCKNLNCFDDEGNSRNHGEAWCGFDYLINSAEKKTYYFGVEGIITRDQYNWKTEPVGSMFVSYYCLNGEIHMENCEDYRNQVCDQGKCIRSHFDECVEAGTNQDDCNTKYCFFNGEGVGCGRIKADPDEPIDPIKFPTPSGLSGVITEDYKHCWVDGLAVELTSENAGGFFEDGEIPSMGEAGISPMLIDDIIHDSSKGLGICMAKISGGNSEESSGLCDMADLEPKEIIFRRVEDYGEIDLYDGITSSTDRLPDESILAYHWYLELSDEDVEKGTYGWAGAFYPNKDGWKTLAEYGYADGKVYPIVPENALLCDEGNLMREGTRAYGGNTASGLHIGCGRVIGYDQDLLNKDGKTVYVPIDPWVKDMLDLRCKKIGDCDGKANWIGVMGSSNTKDYLKPRQESSEFTKLVGNPSDTYWVPSEGSECSSFNEQLNQNPLQRGYGLTVWRNCNQVRIDNGVEYCGCDLYELGNEDAYIQDSEGNNIRFNEEFGEKTQYYVPCKVDAHAGGGSIWNSVTCTLQYDCEPTRPVWGGDDCGKCGADGLPCSTYRCESLGRACELKNPNGADKAYCTSSDDLKAPTILSDSVIPPSPIEPYTAVDISVTTDEISYCRFDIGASSVVYNDMEFDLGKNWSAEHSVRLYLPGQKHSDKNYGYDLISDDGKYDLFVRCEDVAGNPSTTPYKISFEVMDKPDTTAPFLSDFKPVSLSGIKTGETTQEIWFKMHEPAECRWSINDVDYDLMENNFACDTQDSDYGMIHGYACAGTLTGITTQIGSQSTFNIRCKDQLWLDTDNPNPSLYHRNKHSTSVKYILKPSPAFSISSLTPKGKLKKSVLENSVLIEATTTGGSQGGVAECKWKLFEEDTYDTMENTDSARHNQRTSNLSAGIYNVFVKCGDSAGNIAEAEEEFEIELDYGSPRVTRAYYKDEKLNIITNEPSQCRFTNDESIGCNFDWQEGTVVDGVKEEHTISWAKEKTFYIRCEDYYNNRNPGCGIIIRTY